MNPAPQQSLRSAPTVKALSPVAVITATRSAALEYARKIASNAPLVVQLLKRFVDRTVPKGPSEMAGLARREVDAITLSVDAAEGLAAFRDKRAISGSNLCCLTRGSSGFVFFLRLLWPGPPRRAPCDRRAECAPRWFDGLS